VRRTVRANCLIILRAYLTGSHPPVTIVGEMSRRFLATVLLLS
jgi:hypothetical protein